MCWNSHIDVGGGGGGVRSLANLPESLFSGVLTLTICMRGL